MIDRFYGWLIGTLVITALPWVAGRAQAQVPPGGVDVINGAALKYTGAADAGTVDQPNTGDADQAIRCTTLRPTDYPWDIGITAPSIRAIEKDDVLLLTARMRTISTASETGDGRIEIVFEQSTRPHDKSLIARHGVRPEAGWTTMYFPFRAQQDFAAGAGQVSIRMGFGRQVVEIAGVRVTNFAKTVPIESLPMTLSTYEGRQPDAAWRVDALKRIEQLRKSDLRITVVNAAGRAVPDAKVHVQMRRHAYAFGSAVDAQSLLKTGPDYDIYRQHVRQMFNRVVIENDLKWPAWSQDSQPALDAIKWLKENHIEVRGHNIVWPSWKYTPKSLRSLENDPVALAAAISARVTDAATAVRGRVVEWDVVNEPFTERDILNILGDDVMAGWFRLARAADPRAKLFINDFPSLAGGKHLDHYEKTITRLLELKAPLDGIGLQCHYGADLVPPVEILKALDRFGKFNLPLQATELDIETYDQQLQADYLRDHMIAFFSHPSTNGVMMWGFWEGRHWKPAAALYRQDWTPRPNALAWNDLVFRQWWTDTQTTTNAQGTASVRGFLGDYLLTVTAGGKSVEKSVSLDKPGSEVRVTLPTP